MVLSSKGVYGTAMPAWNMQARYAHAYLTGSWLNVNRPPGICAKNSTFAALAWPDRVPVFACRLPAMTDNLSLARV
ncbi:MAG TPA: hypothetical protein PLJ77_06000 [Dokdonella sp.]|uniref:hypothetical protein n=1 Tax=Dokdonella sp. TaxID=2291710 RepID=UPI002CC8DAE6|nr:hypothetical protein [Xanthomonadales bacterium]MBL0222798.1 hypothetical protein [Xanthomonadales bacterium]HQV72635.1 hypothetical protein [Dokdonella sp.]HQW76421.1 hypothetical protein [Dokdonella sp.]HQZ62774.1 hypothetical protein [Dokdonella sp.]